jgi:hypothetical protein
VPTMPAPKTMTSVRATPASTAGQQDPAAGSDIRSDMQNAEPAPRSHAIGTRTDISVLSGHNQGRNGIL